MSQGERAIAYHQRTKHYFHRYARSLGYLDWATQPDPFRRYAGAELIELPFRDDAGDPAYEDLFLPGAISPKPITLETIAALFELSLGLSAWKQIKDSRWALRINPSSGNLHPTEGYLICGAVAGLSENAGVFHYAPKEHGLELRASFDPPHWYGLVSSPKQSRDRQVEDSPRRGAGSKIDHERHLHGSDVIFLALTSVVWREAWKYGERAYRYCQEDAGHAFAAIVLSAALNGWHAALMNGVTDDQVARLLGLTREEDFAGAEHEEPDLMIAISPDREAVEAFRDAILGDEQIQKLFSNALWTGKANRLSMDHVRWEVIEEVAAACVKAAPHLDALPAGERTAMKSSPHPNPLPRGEGDCGAHGIGASAAQIIRQRRSAVAFDGRTPLPAQQFYVMLSRVMPARGTLWSALGPPSNIHLGLFVHRVTGLPPGLYCVPRTQDGERLLSQAMHSSFRWKKPDDCTGSLPLFLLEEGDATALAAQVSCGQEIAGDSAFSLGFIAEFEEPLRKFGDWYYRRLHWEAGAIAQVLYLEAEAVGRRATGIGCFFDDPVHEVFGLTGTAFQSLYHFTLGGPVEDTRLTTARPYPPELISARKVPPSAWPPV